MSANGLTGSLEPWPRKSRTKLSGPDRLELGARGEYSESECRAGHCFSRRSCIADEVRGVKQEKCDK